MNSRTVKFAEGAILGELYSRSGTPEEDREREIVPHFPDQTWKRAGELNGDVELNSEAELGMKLNESCAEDLSFLHELDEFGVHTVSLEGVPLDESELVYLKRLSPLNTLILRDTDISDKAVRHLKAVEGLRNLDVRGTRLSKGAIEELERVHEGCRVYYDKSFAEKIGGLFLTGLESLRAMKKKTLRFPAGTPTGELFVREQPRKVASRAPGAWSWFTSNKWQHFGLARGEVKIPAKLDTKLVVTDPEADLSPLARQEKGVLQALDLRGCHHSADDLAYISALGKLKALILNRTRVTDDGLHHLRDLGELKILGLSSTGVSDAGIELLDGLSMVETLFLTGTLITDGGVMHLSPFRRLRELDLSRTLITDQALELLSDHAELRMLVANHTEITNRGLQHLHGLRRLRRLHLVNTRVSEEGVERLNRKLPDCQVHWERN